MEAARPGSLGVPPGLADTKVREPRGKR